MKKSPVIVISVCVLFILVFFLGPRASFDPVESPVITPLSISLDSLDLYVHLKDLGVPDLKPNNESRIRWADSIRKTRYSLVYLHGFSASPLESHLVPFEVADRYGMNLYIPLLTGHGRDDIESFADLQPNDLVSDAKEAIAIGQLIGEDVIVMSCSTGSTLSIYLAGGNLEMIDALIMYSPNIAIYNKMATLLTGPWGNQLLNALQGTYRLPDSTGTPEIPEYWTTTYRNEGLIALQDLLDQTMTTSIFKEVEQPYFLGYYYKDEENQDHVISIEAVKRFDESTNTPTDQKQLVAFPEAGAHVITHPQKSKSVEEVKERTFEYIESVLKIAPR